LQEYLWLYLFEKLKADNMVEFKNIKKLNSHSLSIKIDFFADSVVVSDKYVDKSIGYAVGAIGLLLYGKAFVDLAITNGYGLAPLSFQLKLIFGIVGTFAGVVILLDRNTFKLTFNFKDNYIVIDSNYDKNSEPRKIAISKIDRFEAKEEFGTINLLLKQGNSSIKLFCFSSQLKQKYPYIKEELIRELNNNIS